MSPLISESTLARFKRALRIPCSTRFIIAIRIIWRETSVP